jgi:glycosyltransferase involved in cell wall biosynthesis
VNRILFLDHATALGGAEISLFLILKKFDYSIFHPILACPYGSLWEAGREVSAQIVEFEFPRLRRSVRALPDLLTKAKQLASIANFHSADVVYANTVRTAIYGSLAARMSSTRFVWHMRDFWLSENRPVLQFPDRAGKAWIGFHADCILANSQAVARHLPYPEKTRVVYNGVDTERFQPPGDISTMKALFGLPDNQPIVGTVSRLRPWKGADRFIRVAAEISQQDKDVIFLVVGGSPFDVRDGYAESLHRLVDQLNVSDRVVFTGQLEDIRPALSTMDVFVHPGEPEPFGLVLIEAMAMQKPVVGFNHGALPEIVKDGETGFLISPGKEKDLVDAILTLLRSPRLMERMGIAGRKRVETNFSADRMAAEVSDILTGLTMPTDKRRI